MLFAFSVLIVSGLIISCLILRGEERSWSPARKRCAFVAAQPVPDGDDDTPPCERACGYCEGDHPWGVHKDKSKDTEKQQKTMRRVTLNTL